MKAIVVTDQAAGTAGMKLMERPEPQRASLASLSGANYGDVVVQVHAAGFTGDELTWPSTWTDRVGRDRTPSIPGHELAGVVTALGYGTTGLSIGQRVFGLTDWYRDGTLAESQDSSRCGQTTTLIKTNFERSKLKRRNRYAEGDDEYVQTNRSIRRKHGERN